MFCLIYYLQCIFLLLQAPLALIDGHGMIFLAMMVEAQSNSDMSGPGTTSPESDVLRIYEFPTCFAFSFAKEGWHMGAKWLRV